MKRLGVKKVSSLTLLLLLGAAKASIGSEIELVLELPASENVTNIQGIEGLDNQPRQIVFSTQNVGAGCGGGTPASAWKLILDPNTDTVLSVSRKQSLSKIQNVRDMIFESSDGKLFTGGGWCGEKPPYFSGDGGETWRSADKGVHPPNSTFFLTEFNGNVYAGTGYNPSPSEVYRWVGNATNDWERVFTVPQRGYVTAMAAYKNKLFVGTNLYAVGCSSSAPIYVSSNGSTFNATAGIPLCYEVYDILVVNEQLIAKVRDSQSNYYWYHWDDTSAQWGNPSPMNLGTYSYLHSVSSGNLIYAYGRAPSDSSYGIYQSDDIGQSWEQIASTNAFTSVSMEVYGNALYVATSADSSGKAYIYRIKSDSDSDGIPDNSDNCKEVANPDQLNNDGDAQGDACDTDDDNDTVLDSSDNCPLLANADQADNDGDSIGDACDDDDDNDTVLDAADNCKFTANADQSDVDGDGQGDACDGDRDGDGIVNETDNCPAAANADQADNDGDAQGDVCDADDDNDAVLDTADNCPLVENADQNDLDGDNIGDACDIDKDGDSVNNETDNCPVNANADQEDTDSDGSGDACDADDDNDTVLDAADNCPLIVNADQSDADHDGQGDVCDGDLDGDGLANNTDNCPNVANGSQADFDHDGSGDACDDDVDGDGVANSSDVCGFTELNAVVKPAEGCSIAQLCPCEGPRGTTGAWKNHGGYVSCTAKSAESFLAAGLITAAEKDVVCSEAGQSNCGVKK